MRTWRIPWRNYGSGFFFALGRRRRRQSSDALPPIARSVYRGEPARRRESPWRHSAQIDLPTSAPTMMQTTMNNTTCLRSQLNPTAPYYVLNPYGSGESQYPTRTTRQPGHYPLVIVLCNFTCKLSLWYAQTSGPLVSGPVARLHFIPFHTSLSCRPRFIRS